MTSSVDAPLPTGVGAYRPVLALVAASTFLAMVAYSGPLGNAATLNAEFDATAAGATWMLASMSASLAATLLAAGILADRLGRRRVFLIGALVFVVANVLGACSGGVAMFVFSRLLVGAGATGMIATGLGLVAATGAGPSRQATTATSWSVAMGLGVAVGPLFSGLLDLFDAWRLFYVLLAVSGGVVWLLAMRIAPKDHPVPREQRRRFDALGFALLLGFLCVLITAIIGVRAGFTPLTVSLLAASGILFVALFASQRYGRAKLIDPKLLTHRPFLASIIAALGTGLGMVGTISFSGTYLVGALGISTMQAGLVTLWWAVMSVVAALAFARIAARIGGAAQLTIGLGGVAGGLLLLLGISDLEQLPRFALALAVTGAATGVLNTGLARQAVATVPPKDVATGTAASNSARYIGAAIGMSVASIVSSGGLIAAWNTVVWGAILSSLVCMIAVVLLTLPVRDSARLLRD